MDTLSILPVSPEWVFVKEVELQGTATFFNFQRISLQKQKDSFLWGTMDMQNVSSTDYSFGAFK